MYFILENITVTYYLQGLIQVVHTSVDNFVDNFVDICSVVTNNMIHSC